MGLTLNRYTQKDTWIALGILPTYYFFLNYMLLGRIYLQRLDVFVLSTLFTALVWTPAFFLHALPAVYLRQRYPHIRQTWMRLSFAVLIHMIMSSAVIILLFYLYGWVDFPGFEFNTDRLRWALVLGIVGNLVANIVHESVYTFEKWSQTISETEKLKKANLQSQLDSLKQQVNPHFLFNSLNTLSSLIDEDTEKAELFIEELSSVYRYLLQTNENALTSLRDEMAFIESYFHLLKTRYGSGIELDVSIADRYREARLPPLTLQMLVENAVKHNIILSEQPLQIRIETTPTGQLSVSNNVQRKNVRVASNGVGLSNIATKYQLLGHQGLEIDKSESCFRVTLPLLPLEP
ncbi:sensor histidine kinase [Larkinella insperata]|uniref:Sensor histidine kinase n=1 Tax=Larkinella insperata TaxID=332158 RepID=A0ABW3Q0U7_9BACT|nr:histidine kinase [Larkinella insperata]